MPLDGERLGRVVPGLGRRPLFAGPTADQIAHVAPEASLEEFAADEAVVEQGRVPDGCYVILSGTASVRVTPSAGSDPVEVPRIGMRDSVGEIGLLNDEPARTATWPRRRRARRRRARRDLPDLT